MKTATDLTRVARTFHALSDPTRLRVLDMLANGEKCVCDLQEAVGAAQSRLSFHLKVLRDAGLVNDRRQGRWVYYSLKPDAMDELSAFIQERKPELVVLGGCACGESHEDSCCD